VLESETQHEKLANEDDEHDDETDSINMKIAKEVYEKEVKEAVTALYVPSISMIAEVFIFAVITSYLKTQLRNCCKCICLSSSAL
jgi:hypothetical protein